MTNEANQVALVSSCHQQLPHHSVVIFKEIGWDANNIHYNEESNKLLARQGLTMLQAK